MIPNCNNFCSGAFPNWLEVNLIEQCNAHCSWCIERDGYHPTEKAEWWVIATKALKHGAQNIILLGGEPTLYKNIKPLISILKAAKRDVWLTTNGSLLTAEYVKCTIAEVTGINISIHHYNLEKNQGITGIAIDKINLMESIATLQSTRASIRMNCNCINGEIDSIDEIIKYIEFAKMLGANKVRFAELKQDDNKFVDLAKIMNYKYGLNDNPFTDGCNSDVVINEMPINFRQMCGLQTTRRLIPNDPKQVLKEVLYYDGNIYNGWQTAKKEKIVTDKKLVELLEDVARGKKSVAEVSLEFGKEIGKVKEVVKSESGGGCQY